MFRNLLLVTIFLASVPVIAENKTILILADSLSASYGISIEQGWVSLLQQRLIHQGYNYDVLNASISGDTTHSARYRLGGLLKGVLPDITIIELGGNDGLRGIQTTEIRDNLAAIIDTMAAHGSAILLVPMLLPSNYGQVYIDKFSGVYLQLAKTKDVTLGRFILDGIAENSELMQSDGIHPTAEAQLMMLNNIWPDLKRLLEKDQGQSSIHLGQKVRT